MGCRFPSNYVILPMLENDCSRRSITRASAGLDNLATQFRAPSWDPQLQWCVPYMWGGTGIIYNRSVTPAPDAWADLWSDRLRRPLDDARRSGRSDRRVLC